MKPRLLNLAAAVSLLLAVAIIALWVRSYGQCEFVSRLWHTSTERCSLRVQSRSSSLDFQFARRPDTSPPIAPSCQYAWNPSPRRWFPFPPVGFHHDYSSLSYSWDITELSLAYWLLLPPTLVLPAVAIVRHRRRRLREKGNLCPTCGYDLRAHSPADRCPECGTVPSGPAR